MLSAANDAMPTHCDLRPPINQFMPHKLAFVCNIEAAEPASLPHRRQARRMIYSVAWFAYAMSCLISGAVLFPPPPVGTGVMWQAFGIPVVASVGFMQQLMSTDMEKRRAVIILFAPQILGVGAKLTSAARSTTVAIHHRINHAESITRTNAGSSNSSSWRIQRGKYQDTNKAHGVLTQANI